MYLPTCLYKSNNNKYSFCNALVILIYNPLKCHCLASVTASLRCPQFALLWEEFWARKWSRYRNIMIFCWSYSKLQIHGHVNVRARLLLVSVSFSQTLVLRKQPPWYFKTLGGGFMVIDCTCFSKSYASWPQTKVNSNSVSWGGGDSNCTADLLSLWWRWCWWNALQRLHWGLLGWIWQLSVTCRKLSYSAETCCDGMGTV